MHIINAVLRPRLLLSATGTTCCQQFYDFNPSSQSVKSTHCDICVIYRCVNKYIIFIYNIFIYIIYLYMLLRISLTIIEVTALDYIYIYIYLGKKY